MNNSGVFQRRLVVVMDKVEYVRLLSESSINDTAKFTAVSSKRPKTRGRPPKNYHPLLQKEKHLESVVRKILPKQIADSVCPKGSRLAHLYGLPKTHKEKLAMRPILSATMGTLITMLSARRFLVIVVKLKSLKFDHNGCN